ncbi:MAG: hypothetical protein J6X85_09935 [Ruminococcus sp.]|nr:hypothetical protein [Ruminococcus sp.]
MSSKDYKDALNDIRLSSEFCARMEKRLSQSSFEDDEYEEVENHVEVIENKGLKKYIAAAAIVAVIGAVGGGGLSQFRDSFSGGQNYGIEEGNEDSHGDTVYEFPFGTVDLDGTKFVYVTGFSGSATTQLTVNADNEKAAKLVNVFSKINWDNVLSSYNTIGITEGNNNRTEADDLQMVISNALNGASGPDYEAISFNCEHDGGYTIVCLDNYGSINVRTKLPDSDMVKISSYSIDKVRFDAINIIMFGEDFSQTTIKFANIKADLVGAECSYKDQTYKITEDQAKTLALCFKASILNRYPDSEYDTPDGEPITFSFIDNGQHPSISLYKNGAASVSKYSEDDNVITETKCSFQPYCYQNIVKVLTNAGEVPCPVDFSNMDGAVLKYTENGNCSTYDLSKKDLELWQTLLSNCSWQTELISTKFDPYTIDDLFMPSSVAIMNKNDIFFIYKSVMYKDGMACLVYTKESSISDIVAPELFSISNHNNLFDTAKTFVEDKTPMNATEFMKKELEMAMSGEKIYLVNENRLSLDSITGFEVSKYALREIFSDLEWEQGGSNSSWTGAAVESTVDPYASISSSGKTVYYRIYTDSVYNSFLINSQGIYTDQITGNAYLCTEPEKLAERLDKLYNEAKENHTNN